MSLVATGATPTLASWTLDQATKDAVEICDRSFSQNNADVPFIKKSTARALYKACTWGVQYGHEALYEPYEKNEGAAENSTYPIAVPPLADFREDYREGIKKCLASDTGYPADSQLQERMACMDGFDAFAGNIAALDPDVKVDQPAVFNADHAYYEKNDYLSVYQDIKDDRTWAYVLADRTFHPNHYPGYRRDMLFAPKSIPDDVKDRANSTLAGMNQSQQGSTTTQNSNTASTQAANNNFWFWYWYWYHYNHQPWYASSSTYTPSTSYRRDAGPRMEYAGAAVSGPPTGGVGFANAATAGTTAVTGSNASRSAPYGTQSSGVEYSKASPWSTTKLSTSTSANLGTAKPFIVRGGLGDYGNKSITARIGSLPKASGPTFNTYVARPSASMGTGGSSLSGSVTVNGSRTTSSPTTSSSSSRTYAPTSAPKSYSAPSPSRSFSAPSVSRSFSGGSVGQ